MVTQRDITMPYGLISTRHIPNILSMRFKQIMTDQNLYKQTSFCLSKWPYCIRLHLEIQAPGIPHDSQQAP